MLLELVDAARKLRGAHDGNLDVQARG
jgi:hypothetical protein